MQKVHYLIRLCAFKLRSTRIRERHYCCAVTLNNFHYLSAVVGEELGDKMYIFNKKSLYHDGNQHNSLLHRIIIQNCELFSMHNLQVALTAWLIEIASARLCVFSSFHIAVLF
jgi:hypothetical protein